MGSVIYCGPGDAFCSVQDFFVQPDARRAPDAVNHDIRFYFIAHRRQILEEGGQVQGFVLWRTRRPITPAFIELFEPFIPDQAVNSVASIAAEYGLDAVHFIEYGVPVRKLYEAVATGLHRGVSLESENRCP